MDESKRVWCGCPHLHCFSSEWDTNEIHISKENYNKLNTHTPPTDGRVQNMLRKTLPMLDPTLPQHETSTCTSSSLWSHQGTQHSSGSWGWTIFLSTSTHDNCASVRVRVCLCSHHIGILRARARVCVAYKAASPLFTYPGYQANSVVSHTSGTSQHRRINDVRAIDALNCEAPSCLCDDSPAGRSNRTCSSQQESS